MGYRSAGPVVIIGLFCGAGGLSEGLSQAGFIPRVAIDFDADALKTYKTNHPNTDAVCADIAKVTGALYEFFAGGGMARGERGGQRV